MFNPYSMLLEIAKSNPQMQPIVEQLQQGINPEQVFRALCKQRNINADEFVQNLQNKYGNNR